MKTKYATVIKPNVTEDPLLKNNKNIPSSSAPLNQKNAGL
jgi:hypothetical protein